MKTLRTTAKVQITIEIDDCGAWGQDCSAGQIYDQAARSATNRVRNAFAALAKEPGMGRPSVRIIGEPIVNAVSYEVK